MNTESPDPTVALARQSESEHSIRLAKHHVSQAHINADNRDVRQMLGIVESLLNFSLKLTDPEGWADRNIGL